MTGEGSSASRTVDARGAALKRLGSYELVRPLAQGGMADIYLARTAEGRHVAIKVLNKERSKEPDACTLFLQEARVVALLDHENIAHVLDVQVSPEGHHYLAMEYVHGSDLRELLSAAATAGRPALPYDTAISIVISAAAGLDHAHRRCTADGKPLRLVHRDVSLSNIMVSHDGGVKVVDFGIAQTSIATIHTCPGVVRGKASYMSPEQCMGDRVDHRTDVFALGVVLYELTTGARCFSGKSDFERMLAVVRGEYIQPRDLFPDFPLELEQVIRCALSIDAGLRYPSAAALVEALERVLAGRQWDNGAAPIVREMRALFGSVSVPWMMTTPEQIDIMETELELAAVPVLPPLPVLPKGMPQLRTTAPTMRAPRFARGTADPSPATTLVDDPRAGSSPPARSAPAARLARGSAPDLTPDPRRTFTGWAPAPKGDLDDDQPTRGRLAMRRPPTAPGLDKI